MQDLKFVPRDEINSTLKRSSVEKYVVCEGRELKKRKISIFDVISLNRVNLGVYPLNHRGFFCSFKP